MTTMTKDEFVEQFNTDMEQKHMRKSTKWTVELVHDLYRLKEEGLSNKEIAERLGVDAEAVGRKLANDRHREKMPAASQNKTKEKSEPDMADALYISQLEALLSESRKANDALAAENEALKKQYANAQGIVLSDEDSMAIRDLLGKAALSLDFVHAIQPEKLVSMASLHVLAEFGLDAVTECGKLVLERQKNSRPAEAEDGNI